MLGWIRRYAYWLHTRWPAGTVEKLPVVGEDGSTAVPGVYVAGDLTGIPLLKFSLDSGARVVRTLTADGSYRSVAASDPDVVDLCVLGGGVAGISAAAEARRLGLSTVVVEASRPFATIVDFPRGKPIYTYPRAMEPAGEMVVTAEVKEDLVAELERQRRALGIEPLQGRAHHIERERSGALRVVLEEGPPIRARRVVVAIGRSGSYRRLGIAGEDRRNVYNRLHDPADFCDRKVLVVGGGDSALEAAIALASCGAEVTLSYRRRELSRPKPENVAKVHALASDAAAEGARGGLRLRLGTRVQSIGEGSVELVDDEGVPETVPNDVVFTMLGREAPLDFFRRSGIPIRGEMRRRNWTMLGLFVLFCTWLYNWKSGGYFASLWQRHGWFPYGMPHWLSNLGQDPHSVLGILLTSAHGPSFWYTLAYSTVVVVFGIRRIRRRKTPYVTAQTLTLTAVQVIPLFLLPELILPWLDHHGWLPQALADTFFPKVTYGHGREFWRAYGLILAWPLNVYNVFTAQPLWGWIGLGFVQTFVLIPWAVYQFGKGAYCGWICSCGALAETLGDGLRQKMPHGPLANRWNMLGQGVLAVAFALLLVRIAGWMIAGEDFIDRSFFHWLHQYKWYVDVGLAGILGYGLYFWFSGRMWCRFACPLAALMHIYARFSRFRIFAEKSKCISCNVCTSVCHQGIDIMSFANKGKAMADPQCVRCSACVQSCPTGVLYFGKADAEGREASVDRLWASPVRQHEGAAPTTAEPAPGETVGVG